VEGKMYILPDFSMKTTITLNFLLLLASSVKLRENISKAQYSLHFNLNKERRRRRRLNIVKMVLC
jgi:hypothetical protein